MDQIIIILTNPLFYAMVVVTITSLLGIAGFICGLKAIIKVESMERSTHSVQYMPIDPQVDAENEQFIDDWATSDESLKEQHDILKGDLEDNMPSFVPEDKDKTKYSF